MPEPLPSPQLVANGSGWWLGLDRQAFTREVQRREQLRQGVSRRAELQKRGWMLAHGVRRVPLVITQGKRETECWVQGNV